MNFPLRLLLLGTLLWFTEASTSNNNSNTEQWPYSPAADFVQCKEAIVNGTVLSSDSTFTPYFVSAHGTQVHRPEDASGVRYETCVKYCTTGSAPFKWTIFASQFTAWLLPYIALTAQLPYQAITTWDNLMSAFLTVGSPALAAYSLILTFLGTRWLEKQCAATLDQIPASTPEDWRRQTKLQSIFNNMKRVLRLAQQEPYENLEFQAIPENLKGEVDWWGKLDGTVQRSKRGYTASFVHQLLWVTVAFAFSIVDAFGSEKVCHLFLNARSPLTKPICRLATMQLPSALLSPWCGNGRLLL